MLDTRAGGRARYLRLASRAVRANRRFRPDVLYAHFLVPSGLIAALVGRPVSLALPRDLAWVGLALAAAHDAMLVSGDRHLLGLGDAFPVRTPAGFLPLLDER